LRKPKTARRDTALKALRFLSKHKISLTELTGFVLEGKGDFLGYRNRLLAQIAKKKDKLKNARAMLDEDACGSIDSRKVAAEHPWNGLEQNDDEESDDEGVDVNGEDDEEEDEKGGDAETGDPQDGEEEDDDADQDDEIELPLLSHKRKRKRGPKSSMPLPPSKKVSFNARGTKSDHRCQ
jgi:hypothetical protein